MRRFVLSALAALPLLVGCDVSSASGNDPTPPNQSFETPAPTESSRNQGDGGEPSGSKLTDWTKEIESRGSGGASAPEPTDPAAEAEDMLREMEREYRQEVPEGYCADVTSFDYNWDNDYLCTDDYGRQFYTSREGAGLG